MKRITVILAITLAALIGAVSLFGISSLFMPLKHESESSETQQITDMFGRTLTVPINIERIVAVNAGTLRLFTYMEASDLICGVEDREVDPESYITSPYSVAHPEYYTLPVVGSSHGGDAELIATQDPDVVFKYDVEIANLDLNRVLPASFTFKQPS